MSKTLGTVQHKALTSALIKARKDAGLTQTELANLLGEYQSFVARLESGQRRIDVIERLTLARILQFDVIAMTLIQRPIADLGAILKIGDLIHQSRHSSLSMLIMLDNRDGLRPEISGDAT